MVKVGDMAKTSNRPAGGYASDVLRLLGDYPEFIITADIRAQPHRYTAHPRDGDGEELTATSRDGLADEMDACRGRRK